VAADLQDFQVERAGAFGQWSRKRGYHMVITRRPEEKRQPRQAAILLCPRRFGVAARCAALLAACALVEQCSAVPVESAAAPSPPSNYGVLASNTVKGFKPFTTYRDFEISAPRWVHAETGWNWLVCLRYEDRGQQNYYAIFIQGDSVVNSRYDILTDHCGAQQYVPFDLMTGVIKSPPPMPQQPTY
jgi:hypothetical protein